ncbi:MAG: Fic family protein [Prevotellaceae bacterium]|jgi:fido (protein-threonine AMPylation protein)|nr:Fic family protein [Prevotellaceae bacterium]
MQNFDDYIKQGEPSQKEKAQIWQTAIGLQDVDGLKPSEYLLETAKEHIEDKITIDEVIYRLDNYYKQLSNRENEKNERKEEADKVSARIAEILSEKTFSFSPVEYIDIHHRLFTGIYKFAGKIRDYNIAKSEWVLDGDTVLYASSKRLKETLEHDFKEEKSFSYKGLTTEQVVEHLAHFVAYLWQIHIFGEGNTRTTAVFLIKYLRKLGFKNVNNDLFAKHSLYFRNALVRANYEDLHLGIYKTDKHLIQFLSNLLLNENHDLKNRYLHIKSANVPANVPVNVPVNIKTNLIEKNIFDILKNNPKITYDQIAIIINKNRKTVQRTIISLKAKELIERIGSDKTGEWKVIEK